MTYSMSGTPVNSKRTNFVGSRPGHRNSQIHMGAQVIAVTHSGFAKFVPVLASCRSTARAQVPICHTGV